jgi:hypothetical protein
MMKTRNEAQDREGTLVQNRDGTLLQNKPEECQPVSRVC